MCVINKITQKIRNYINVGQYDENGNTIGGFYYNYFIKNPSEWNCICAALDIIEDTQLAINNFHSKDLGNDIGEKYLRIYGLFQALYLQQDATAHLYKIVCKINDKSEGKLIEELSEILFNIRDNRNCIFGHPVEKKVKSGVKRAFLNRHNFNQIIIWSSDNNLDNSTHLDYKDLYNKQNKEIYLDYKDLINKQNKEVYKILEKLYKELENKWQY